MNSVFVTGTDTDAGKTVVSVGIIKWLQQQGLNVAAMKPVASGCDVTADGLRNDDALKLSHQANIKLPYNTINPYAFEPAIAPHIAAQQVNKTIDLDLIKHSFTTIHQQADAVVVEGAGGWLVPLNQEQSIADLAIKLNLPVVLVVGIRLGCINHALLTIKAIGQSGLKVKGWVANMVEPNNEATEIIDTLKQHIIAPCLGVIPHLSEQQHAADYLQWELDHD